MLAVGVVSVIAAAAMWWFNPWPLPEQVPVVSDEWDEWTALRAEVLPEAGIELPIEWGDLGARLVQAGVIDRVKLEQLYAQNGVLPAEVVALIEPRAGRLRLNTANSAYVLNMLWALGLSNESQILEFGPMRDGRYETANFASTGGWTLATGAAMDHYSRHAWVELTPAQAERVESVAKNIYRPCCNNPTHFPDCNHGMAMLGLLQLLAAADLGEEEMYRFALQANAYWFPDNYLVIAKYLRSQGKGWAEADPKELLGYNYSSASGYQQILAQVTPPAQQGGGSCGV